MKKYDLICMGTGSAMNIIEPMIDTDPEIKIAVIDKDDPGGICLTRGCIPSKLLLYPAELVRLTQGAKDLGIPVETGRIDFEGIMERMRSIIGRDIDQIRAGLSQSENVDYYRAVAEFIGPYQLRVGDMSITSDMIFLCLGSKPLIPPVKGLHDTGYDTSDTILNLEKLPASLIILGGGYIAAEYGHFFSAMGSEVTVIGRNPRFLPAEEPEVSELALKEMSKHMTIVTHHQVEEVERSSSGKVRVTARDGRTGKTDTFTADRVLVATGRASNAEILRPDKAGIETDEKGWIVVNEHLETSKPNIWAFGDATGKHMFKHVANYESKVVLYNAVLGEKVTADYHAVPHAVFSHPEIASVGLKEAEAVTLLGEDRVLIGFQRYRDTAKGEAMGARDEFVKVVMENGSGRILGAHIIGPQASVLIQEIITLMYTSDRTIAPIREGMHIHPSLSEVVERAFVSLMRPREYQHLLKEGFSAIIQA